MMKEFYRMYGSADTNVGDLIEKIKKAKVYFGHRSVGSNMLKGVQQWEQETGVQIPKRETTDFLSAADVPLVHFPIGANSDPQSKIDDFVKLVDGIPDQGNPIAFFKLCYVDITACTVHNVVFDYYKEKMLHLKKTYPHIRFVACTVPIMGIQKGWKAMAKKILGRHPAGRLGNMARDKFNTRVREELGGEFPIFDIAGIEATAPDGSPVSYSFQGKSYPRMPAYYTYDLGHLNEFGSRTLSYNLLAFLAEQM